MVKLTPSTVLTGAATTLAVGTIGYIAWFDYQRRNNLEFRRNLLKERRRIEKVQSAQANQQRASQGEALKNAVRDMRDERTPQSVEEREAYFLEHVAMGEALAAQGEAYHVAAAVAFFKGLQVYPQPQELLMIYQRTQPAEIIALLMEALRLSIELEGSSSSSVGGGVAGGSSSKSQQPRGGAILEEIDTEESTTTSNNASAASNDGERSGNASENTNTSSPEARSYVDVEYPGSSA